MKDKIYTILYSFWVGLQWVVFSIAAALLFFIYTCLILGPGWLAWHYQNEYFLLIYVLHVALFGHLAGKNGLND